jgi:hypothetical protein
MIPCDVLKGVRPRAMEAKMKKLALFLLAAVSVAGTAAAVSAQSLGGNPYYDNPALDYRVQYRERYYDDDGYRRRYRRDYVGGYYGAIGGGWNTWNSCPPNYTIQDGVCKPYLGGYGGGWNTWNGCPPHYTIQGGRCLPYRGP